MADDLRLRVILDLADRALGPLKRIAAGSKGLSDKLREARGELRQLQAQQQAITQFRTLSNEFKASAATAQALRTRLAELRAVTPANAAEARKLSQEMGATERKIKRASAAVDEKQRRLMGLRERLRSVGVNNLAQDEATLAGRMAEANRQIDLQRGKLERLAQLRRQHGQQMMHVGMAAGAGMAMQAVGRRGVEATLGPVRQFMAHEDAMLGIARQVPGARDEMGRLTAVYRTAEEQVRSLSGEIPLATTAIADMMTAAARMEVPTDQLAAQVKLAAEMAIAFDAVPDEIAESMGKVAKNFKIPLTDIRGLADAINYLDDNAISKGADIIDFLNRTSGVVSTVSMSAQQAAALGSTLLTLGERGETASTATNAIVQKLAAATKGTKKMKSAIAEIGMTPEAIQKGMSTDATSTLMKVIDAIGNLPSDKRIGVMVEMIGLEHSDTLAKLVDKPEELQRQLELAQGTQAAGSMAREAQARYATLSAQWQMAKNRAFNLASAVGESLKPALVDTMHAVSPWVERLRTWSQANPTVVSGVMKAALALTALTFAAGLVLVPLALLVGKMLLVRFMFTQMLVAGTGLMRLVPLISAVGRGLLTLASFGGTALRGFSLIGLAIALVIKFWQPFNAFIQGMVRGFGDALGPALQGAGGALRTVGAALAPVIPYLAAAYNWVRELFAPLQLTADGFDKVSSAGQLVGQVMGNIVVALASAPMQFYNAGMQMMRGLANGIVGGLTWVKDAVVGAATQAVGWFKSKLGIQSPSRVFMALGQHIPEGAALGIERGHPRLQAAALAMAALPAFAAAAPMQQAGSIDARAPLSATRAPMAAAVGDTTITVTVNAAPGQDAQAIARAVATELDRRQRAARSRTLSQLSDIE